MGDMRRVFFSAFFGISGAITKKPFAGMPAKGGVYTV